jgi:hypothetical protein
LLPTPGVKLSIKAAFKQVGHYHDRNEQQKESRLRKKLADIVGEWEQTGAVTARGVSPEGGSRSPSPVIPDAKMAEQLEQPSSQRKGAVPVKVVIPVHTKSVSGDAHLAASLAKAEARVHALTNQRQQWYRSARKAIKQCEALESAGTQTRTIIDDLRAELQGVDVERADLQDQLKEFIEGSPSQEAETICAELKTVEGGRYSDTVRLIYYTLLFNGVSPAQVQGVIGRVLSPTEKADVEALGWTEQTWQEGSLEPFHRDFVSLSLAQQAAAKALGYSAADFWCV